MTDRERLIRLIKQAERKEISDFITADIDKKIDMSRRTKISCGMEYLVDYLLEHGVIVPPCKFGERVYVITSQTSDNRNLYIFEDTITHYRICDGCTIMCFVNHLGVPDFNWDNVFLTREEAEKALMEREEND